MTPPGRTVMSAGRTCQCDSRRYLTLFRFCTLGHAVSFFCISCYSGTRCYKPTALWEIMVTSGTAILIAPTQSAAKVVDMKVVYMV